MGAAPNPNSNSQPPAAWCYSGNQIKRWRSIANVSREALATAATYAPETIASMERGVRMPSPRLLDIADELCGAQGMLSAAKEYVRRERYSARAVDFIEREREATSLWTYEVVLIPGLLQTRAYAQALIDNRIPPLDVETVEERVAARMERQAILTEPKPPVGLSFVLYEAVLRSPLADETQRAFG
ncbi:Scr1 family TA system antitoxin-like transcriptional regulator [Streptomyces tendae]|uniref:Scr1 family TA system antitoxin-like transcriptional regulator n=1 Tax=Streptomyces tendae TaxID=1932 RepID=UPI0036484757